MKIVKSTYSDGKVKTRDSSLSVFQRKLRQKLQYKLAELLGAHIRPCAQ